MRYPFSRCSKLKLVHFEFDRRFSWFFACGFFKSTKPAQIPVKEASSFWSENDWNPSIAKLMDSGSFRARRSQFCRIFVSISSSGSSQISWLARFIALQWFKNTSETPNWRSYNYNGHQIRVWSNLNSGWAQTESHSLMWYPSIKFRFNISIWFYSKIYKIHQKLFI